LYDARGVAIQRTKEPKPSECRRMSTREASAPSLPIGSKADLVEAIASGCKPAGQWRIGTEHEKFLFHTDTLAPVPYDGPRGIRAIFEALMARYGWQAIREGETIIALKRQSPLGSASVSLEPGGQFELSGAPLSTLHEVHAETAGHLYEVRAIGREFGIGMLGMGFTPKHTRADMPTMPKRRYAVMTRYMPRVGHLGLDMMYRTCTIQVNLDFASEADMVTKLRVSLALQPIAQALFAASPFLEGRPNGYQTLRGEVWRDTDKDRTGNLPFAFEAGMSFERYVDYALDVPMYFVYRDGEYIDVAGASFRDFMAGRLAAKVSDPRLQGLVATMDDWSDHLTTLFPDVRLKRFLEMRGADGGPLEKIVALPAYWVGLLYDSEALAAAWDLVKSWTSAERDALREGVPRQGLTLAFRRGTVRDIAGASLEIARAGLRRRQRLDASGRDETHHLDVLAAIVASGRTASDDLLAAYEGWWQGNIDRLFTETAL
jgi:glutamate--cysteine ligase